MGEIVVKVNGRDFALSCADGQEARIRRLAQYVDAKVGEFSKNLGQIGEARLILLAALVITDENDVLRDEGEAYAHKLANAGVKVTAVRYLGGIHDFVMLNPISATPEARGAIAQANDALRKAFANKEASQQVSAK